MIYSVLTTIDNSWENKRPLKALAYTFIALPFHEYLEGSFHTYTALIKAPIAIIKLPFSFLSFCLKNQTLSQIHKDWTGITNVFISAFKATICFVNITWAPMFSFLSPKENTKYHQMCGLIPSQIALPTNQITVPTENFSNISGMETVKEQIQTEVISPIKDNEAAAKYGIHPSKGVLLYGRPGCGKTHIAKCIAGELGFKFRHISSSSIGSIYMHGSALKIKEVFEEARKLAPCILFFDDFDGIAGNRENFDSGSASQTYANELTEFLTQIDQTDPRQVIVIAATNLKDKIDPALVRTGRFDLHIEIGHPDQEARQKLIEYYVKNGGISHEVIGEIDYQELSQKTKDYSCSELKTLVEKAARAAFKKRSKITTQTFREILEMKKNDSVILPYYT